MAAKSRPEHINIMAEPGMDCALRTLAANSDITVTAVVRKALEDHFKDNGIYQAIVAYVKSLTPEQYANIKLKLQNRSLPPSDRIPDEIKSIINTFGG